MELPFSERYILCREFLLPDGSIRRCWPDAASLLTIPHQGKDWRLAILWEYDRSTESRAQIREKSPGFESLIATATWQQIFPDAHGVRIFFVVPSPVRLAIVAGTFQGTPIAGHLRIAVNADIHPAQILAETIWRTLDGESQSLL